MVKSKRNLLIVVLSVVFAFALISFASVKTANADDLVITMKTTAEARVDLGNENNRSGIRFTALVSESVPQYTSGATQYAGMIVAQGTYEAADLTHDDDVIDVPAKVFDEELQTGTSNAFNVVIYDIAANNAYAQELTARAYIYNNGNYTYSSAVCVRSLAQVASMVIASDAPTGEKLEVLEGYVDGANPVLKLNGEAMNEDVAEDLTLYLGKTVSFAVEPANIVCSIAGGASTNLEQVGETNTFKGKAITASAQNVVIKLGSKEYSVNVSVARWIDPSHATNVLYDFNEAESINAVTNSSNDPRYTATFSVSEGTLKVASDPYGTACVYPEPFKVGDVGGIYLKVKYPTTVQHGHADCDINAKKFMFVLINGKEIRIQGDPAYLGGFQPNDNKGDFFYVPVRYEDLISKGFTDDTVIEKIGMFCTGVVEQYEIDEIGVYKAADEYEFNYFDAESDTSLVRWRWEVARSWVDPTTAASIIPGITSGALKYGYNEHSHEQYFYPKQTFMVSEVAQIKIKMYVSERAGETSFGINVSINESAKNVEGSARAEYRSLARTTLVEIVVDLSSYESISGDRLNAIAISHYWPYGSDINYIDSITVVPKTV